MDRAQQQLREQHRDDDRDRQRDERRRNRRRQRGVEVLTDEQRGDADANRSELRVAEEQRLAELDGAPLAPVDLDQLL